jgi:hypothetical protein
MPNRTKNGRMAETDLYPPVKALLEKQGYSVKAEVRGCDVVGTRGKEQLVIVELKTSFSLQLIYQSVDRLAMTDHVYVAICKPKRGVVGDALRLCKRIGIGLICVSSSGSVEVMADPVPYTPRKDKKRVGLLLREFTKREGDPNLGGSNGKIVTAYKQDAIKCSEHLRRHGPMRIKDLRNATGVARAANILRDNHYGWFAKEARGIYGLASPTRHGREEGNFVSTDN